MILIFLRDSMMYKNVKIEIIKGDITEEKTDAIVNAANNKLWMGGGVAGAIKKKGGKKIEMEAISKAPIQIGEAVVTSAGRLKVKYVIHAASMGVDFKTDDEKILRATYNSLLRCNDLKIESVSFPAIGTGVGGFPKEKAADIMFNVVKRYIDEGHKYPKKIRFVLFDDDVFNAFINKKCIFK